MTPTDHTPPAPPPPVPRPSAVMTAAAAALRLLPAARWMTGRPILRALRALCGSPWARRRVGPHDLVFDMSDYFQAMMALDYYERDFARLLARVLRPGDTYVDVGAQLGFTAALAARHIGPQGTMILFEPDPRAFARLRAHMQPAPAARAPRVTLHPEACSDHAGPAVLREAPIIGWSQVQPAATSASSGTPVQLVRLDDALAAAGPIRVLKMDVEGHELFALRGLQQTLSAARIDYLYIEKNPGPIRRHGATPMHLHALIAAHGYTAADEDGHRATPETIQREKLENLLYARTDELLLLAAPQSAPNPATPPFPDLAPLRDEALDPDSLVLRANELLYRAASGHLDAAIAAGEQLLADHPGLTWFRGHLAHWYVAARRPAQALAHYETLARLQPDNPEAARLAQQMRAEIALAASAAGPPAPAP